jgi:hypothetical protein
MSAHSPDSSLSSHNDETTPFKFRENQVVTITIYK